MRSEQVFFPYRVAQRTYIIINQCEPVLHEDLLLETSEQVRVVLEGYQQTLGVLGGPFEVLSLRSGLLLCARVDVALRACFRDTLLCSCRWSVWCRTFFDGSFGC